MWTEAYYCYLCLSLGPQLNPITITPKMLITITINNITYYLIVNNPVILLSVMSLAKFYCNNYLIKIIHGF